MRWFRSDFKTFAGDFLKTPSLGVTTPPPAAPVAASASQVDYFDFIANWAASTGATGYYLDVATDSGFTSFVTGFENLDVGNNTSKFVDTLDSNTTYYYRVRAYSAAGTSANSNTISTGTLAFFLDGKTSPATAHSLRILSGEYYKTNGAIATIRKDGDNAEETFYPIKEDGYALTLSSITSGGTTLATWIGSENGFIKTLFGQDPSAINATQTNAANQPQIISAGALITSNSLPSIDLIGGRYFLTGVGSIAPTNYTAIFVRTINIYPSVFRTGFNYKTCGITYNNNGGASYGFGAHLFKNSATSKSDDYNTSTGQALDFIINRTKLDRNQVAATLSAGGGYGPGTSAIGSWSNTSQTFENEFQELIIWESDESANQNDWENEINNYYSIF